jgi:hypothetical protein
MLQPALTTAAAPKPRRGRPPGTLSPLTCWLRGVIGEMRRDGFGQAEVWRRICLIEDGAGDGRSFTVSEETADEFWRDFGADLAGRLVTFESFRSAWRRANF